MRASGSTLEASREEAISVRRFVNDFIAERATTYHDAAERAFEFVCECGDLACDGVVKMTLAEYRSAEPGSLITH